MKRYTRLAIVYFPVLLVTLQVAANLLFLAEPELYYSIGFYLNTFLGTNVLFALFLVLFTFSFGFCKISRSAAVVECLFGVNYLVVQEDNLYNILFQIIAGTAAIFLTIVHFAIDEIKWTQRKLYKS